MLPPVSARRIRLAEDLGLVNVDQAAVACREAGPPFYVACALLRMESNGRNVYGHDKGGKFSKDEWPSVTAANFFQFLVSVMNGHLSNGVGPCQITYAGSVKDGHRDGGYFRQMAEQGLRPWSPHDNMLFGFRILAGHYARTRDWRKAGRLYNGKDSYGILLAKRIEEMKRALR